MDSVARPSTRPTALRDDALINRNTVVIGASAGGVEALTNLVRGLPSDVPATFLVVLHMPAGGSSHLPEILSRSGPLPAVPAEDGLAPETGRIHVAPADRHLILSAGRMFLIDGPRENGFRPAVDTLFRSAARALRAQAVGVVLSGTMDDGAAGLAAIADCGGATIVQDPDDALCEGMPRAAIEAARVDHLVAAAGMGNLIDRVIREPVAIGDLNPVPDQTLLADPLDLPAEGVDLACPDCGGALQEVRAGQMSRFRCRVGHVYSPDALLAGKTTALESALWAALRSLEETASIAGRLAARARESGSIAALRRFEERQADAAERADLVRSAIRSLEESITGPTETALAER
jgi:two-component system, chemotaxis family, protein-glutamate methylesterase/glutaminase